MSTTGVTGALYYMAHPVAKYRTSGGISVTTPENLLLAHQHLAALVQAGIPTIAPWLGLCAALDDSRPGDRAAGIAIDCRALWRCDGIVLCGMRRSEGMLAELGIAQECEHHIIDVVGFAPRPAAREAAEEYLREHGSVEALDESELPEPGDDPESL